MSIRPRVIKAGELLGVQPIKFNASDTLAETERRIEQAKVEIEQLQQGARTQAQKLFQDSRNEGYQAGYQEGFAKAQAEVEARHKSDIEKEVVQRMATLQTALGKTVDQLAIARDQWLGEWEKLAIKVACAIASRIVHRVIEAPNDVAQKTCGNVLSLIGRAPHVTVILNPADAETLRLNVSGWTAATRAIGEVELQEDPGISPGGCRVVSEFGSIDATIETQLERIERELSGEEAVQP